MRLILLAAMLALSACAAAPTPGMYAPKGMPPAQVFVIPERRVEPLPVRIPPARLQSQIMAMSPAELTGWALPEHAATTVRTEMVRGWMPQMIAAWFFEAPHTTDWKGVCEVLGRAVNFRVQNESALTYQQHLDPPQQPYQVHEEPRFRVIGSTLDGSAATPAACAAAVPYGDWFEAPAASAVFYAVNLMERAPRGGFAISCTEQSVDEVTGAGLTHACNGRGYLARLTPGLIKRVEGVRCEGELAQVVGACWRITYHDPRSPGTGSEFHALVGEKVVALSQVLLPPM